MHTKAMHHEMHNAQCNRMHNELTQSHPDARRARLHSGLLLEALPRALARLGGFLFAVAG